jgi:hypothetical protein
MQVSQFVAMCKHGRSQNLQVGCTELQTKNLTLTILLNTSQKNFLHKSRSRREAGNFTTATRHALASSHRCSPALPSAVSKQRRNLTAYVSSLQRTIPIDWGIEIEAERLKCLFGRYLIGPAGNGLVYRHWEIKRVVILDERNSRKYIAANRYNLPGLSRSTYVFKLYILPLHLAKLTIHNSFAKF